MTIPQINSRTPVVRIHLYRFLKQIQRLLNTILLKQFLPYLIINQRHLIRNITLILCILNIRIGYLQIIQRLFILPLTPMNVRLQNQELGAVGIHLQPLLDIHDALVHLPLDQGELSLLVQCLDLGGDDVVEVGHVDVVFLERVGSPEELVGLGFVAQAEEDEAEEEGLVDSSILLDLFHGVVKGAHLQETEALDDLTLLHSSEDMTPESLIWLLQILILLIQHQGLRTPRQYQIKPIHHRQFLDLIRTLQIQLLCSPIQTERCRSIPNILINPRQFHQHFRGLIQEQALLVHGYGLLNFRIAEGAGDREFLLVGFEDDSRGGGGLLHGLLYLLMGQGIGWEQNSTYIVLLISEWRSLGCWRSGCWIGTRGTRSCWGIQRQSNRDQCLKLTGNAEFCSRDKKDFEQYLKIYTNQTVEKGFRLCKQMVDQQPQRPPSEVIDECITLYSMNMEIYQKNVTDKLRSLTQKFSHQNL